MCGTPYAVRRLSFLGPIAIIGDLNIIVACQTIAFSLVLQVVVYAKTWCPHCQKTKDLLGSDEFKGVNILIRDLDIMDDPSGPVLAKSLADMTGQVSIPFMCSNDGNRSFHEAKGNFVTPTVSHTLVFRNAHLYQKTSVPNIFIDGKHFGGNSDIQEAHANGTLKLI